MDGIAVEDINNLLDGIDEVVVLGNLGVVVSDSSVASISNISESLDGLV